MFEPRRLPGGGGDEICRSLQTFGDRFRGQLGSFAIRRLDGDDEFACVGKMLLVKFQSLNGGNIRGQQVEYLDIKMQARKSGGNRNKQQKPPPAKPFHGKNSPSRVSPVFEFSKRHEFVITFSKCQLPFRVPPSSAGGN